MTDEVKTARQIEAEERKARRRRESDQLLADYLQILKNQFYPDQEKRFYQQKRLLILAIIEPAGWAKRKGVAFDDRHYRKILNIVIKTIKNYGNLEKVENFCRYFLHSVQTHLDARNDHYISLGSRIRDTAHLRQIVADVQSLEVNAAPAAETPAEYTENLAQVATLLAGRNPGRKPAAAKKVKTQLDLFA